MRRGSWDSSGPTVPPGTDDATAGPPGNAARITEAADPHAETREYMRVRLPPLRTTRCRILGPSTGGPHARHPDRARGSGARPRLAPRQPRHGARVRGGEGSRAPALGAGALHTVQLRLR